MSTPRAQSDPRTFVLERHLPRRCRCGVARALRQRGRPRPVVGAAPGSSKRATSPTDFRVAGHATEEGQWHGGSRGHAFLPPTPTSSTPADRLTYDMWVDDQHMSTSLTTIALDAEGEQTRLTYTEQGVHRRAGHRRGSRKRHAWVARQLGAFLARGR